MDNLVETMLSNCRECGHAEKSLRTYNTPLSPVTFPQRPWEKLGVDFVGPVGGLNGGYRYILSVVDYFSKWVSFKFMRELNTDVIDFLRKLFRSEEIPALLISDNGVQFV